ncbi:uncharacterized protein EDB91DRAFT_1078599 [Suillus paluster]|uniref:uncharacterized protein n=1 Tax=Suillus paluster TaxID=48578 RepID=UPI001B867BC2|nr:uncharacterized protein EDB91DRAFT_1078599 [Suillus paluster]KAG1750581.1 hypothetical protein EDB91DRAFT_1078599 [Suillus paluster]
MDYYYPNNGGRYNQHQFQSRVEHQQQEQLPHGYVVPHGGGQCSAPLGSYEHQAVVPAHNTRHQHQQQQENYHAEHYWFDTKHCSGSSPMNQFPDLNIISNLKYNQANEAGGDPRPLPPHSQQQPLPATALQPQKRGREEYHGNLLLEDGDSAKKIRKTENDTPSTRISSEAHASKGLKRKATGAKLKTKAKTKIDGEQAMAHLQEQSHWSDEDTKLLLETLLGGDSEFYEGLTGNAKHIFKKVSERILKGRCSPESIKGHYERLRRVFSYILNFESITGNGGGDPDVEVLDEKIENARTAGKDIGNLSGATLKKWYDEGWYKLFNNRLGEHPELVQEEDFRSGTILDTINISSDEGSDGESKDSDTERKTKPKAGQPARKSVLSAGDKKVKPTSQKGVPVPRHKRKASQTGIGSEAAEFFASNVEFLKATADSDIACLKLLEKCELREDKQYNYMVEKGRAEMTLAEHEAKVRHAKEILTTDGMPDKLKAAAHQMLLDYFTIGGQKFWFIIPGGSAIARDINISSVILSVVMIRVRTIKQWNELRYISKVNAHIVQSKKCLDNTAANPSNWENGP